MNLKPNLPQLKMSRPIEEAERMLLSASESLLSDEEPATGSHVTSPSVTGSVVQIGTYTADQGMAQPAMRADGRPNQDGDHVVWSNDQTNVNANVQIEDLTTGRLANRIHEALAGQSSAVEMGWRSHSEPSPSADSPAFLDRIRRSRQPIAVVGFKIPSDLKEELEEVARHNQTDMTKIVVEALKMILPHLPHPPK